MTQCIDAHTGLYSSAVEAQGSGGRQANGISMNIVVSMHWHIKTSTSMPISIFHKLPQPHRNMDAQILNSSQLELLARPYSF